MGNMPTKSPIKKITKENIVQQVYEDLQNRILRNEFSPGEKLPSETQLAVLYDVSRVSVRSALQKLATIGLLDIRVGEGSFVKSMSFPTLMNEVSSVMGNTNLDSKLLEFRYYIERSCIELAINNATDKELDDFLADWTASAESLSTDDLATLVTIDYDFHYTLCRLSHNPLFEMVYSCIKDLFLKSISINLTQSKNNIPPGKRFNFARHTKLIQLLKERKASEAEQLFINMIKYKK